MPGRALTEWLRHHPWLMALVLVVVVALPGALALSGQAAQRDELTACLTRWADASSARAAALGSARHEVDDAEAQLWRTVARLTAAGQSGPSAQQEFTAALAARVRAADAYDAGLRDHPVPAPPRLSC